MHCDIATSHSPSLLIVLAVLLLLLFTLVLWASLRTSDDSFEGRFAEAQPTVSSYPTTVTVTVTVESERQL
jgi:Ca2+/H+ antiporter